VQRERAEANSALPPVYYFCFDLMAIKWYAVKRKVSSTSPFRISASRFPAHRFFIQLCGPVKLFCFGRRRYSFLKGVRFSAEISEPM
jgi:hypothetical protein